MMALAPASASISAEISPVWAPDALGWQSCAPTLRVFEPRARSAKAAIRVAGGQTSRSALPATAGAPASMASNSAVEDLRPFIFQLPAIRGRMALVMAGFPRRLAQSCASRAQRPVPDTARAIVTPLTASLRPTCGPRPPAPPRLRQGGCHFMMLYQLGD